MLFVDHGESAVACMHQPFRSADPDRAITIGREGDHIRTRRKPFRDPEAGKASVFQSADPPAAGPDPEHSSSIFGYGSNPDRSQTILQAEVPELDTVKPRKPAAGAGPEEAIASLHERMHRVLRQTVLRSPGTYHAIVQSRVRGFRYPQQENQKSTSDNSGDGTANHSRHAIAAAFVKASGKAVQRALVTQSQFGTSSPIFFPRPSLARDSAKLCLQVAHFMNVVRSAPAAASAGCTIDDREQLAPIRGLDQEGNRPRIDCGIPRDRIVATGQKNYLCGRRRFAKAGLHIETIHHRHRHIDDSNWKVA